MVAGFALVALACLFLRLSFAWWHVGTVCRDAAGAAAAGRTVTERTLDGYRVAVADAQEVRPRAVARLKRDIRTIEGRLASGPGARRDPAAAQETLR